MNNSFFYNKAQQYIPGGVNSPVRALKSVNMEPIFIQSAKGPYLKDISGNRYIDYIGSWGAMILGHNYPKVIRSVQKQLKKGLSYGTCHLGEVAWAEKICSLIDSIEMVRMVNSGTEATMSAIRLARGYTKRELIIKFRGCYHGHGDSFLIEAGSGALTFGTPSSPGVTKGTAKDTLIADYNDINQVSDLFKKYENQIACVILEPIAGNMGTIPPKENFLSNLRKLCDDNQTLLIFDEIMTGFRVGLQGAQGIYNITPDLTTFGKIVGGGMPVGAYGGKKEIMQQISPEGSIYQAGTLSGNPLATATGVATLKEISKPGFYEQLETLAQEWENALKESLLEANLNYTINRVGSMMTLFFTDKTVTNYQDAVGCDTTLFAEWFKKMIAKGHYLAPSQFETCFLSITHEKSHLNKFRKDSAEMLKEITKKN